MTKDPQKYIRGELRNSSFHFENRVELEHFFFCETFLFCLFLFTSICTITVFIGFHEMPTTAEPVDPVRVNAVQLKFSYYIHITTMGSKQKRTIVLAMLVIMLKNVLICNTYQPYKNTDPDFATSVHHLRLLVLMELDIIPSAFSCFNKNDNSEESLVILKNYLEDFKSSTVTSLNTTISLEQFVFLLNDGYIDRERFADDHVKHPLKAYRTIRRFVHFIDKFPRIMENTSTNLLEYLDEVRKTVKLPKSADLITAMENVLRLKQMFMLTTADLIEGKLGDLITRSGLDLTHIIEIAEHASTLKMYSHAIDLFDEVLQKCRVAEDNPELENVCTVINTAEITNTLKRIIIEHDNIIVGNNYDRTDLSVVPPDSSPYVFDGTLSSLNSKFFLARKKLEINLEFEAFVKLTNHTKLELDMAASPFLYEQLCRGDPLPKLSFTPSDYRCEYFHHTHPFYLIGPLKAEIHNENPFIVQIYDVISSKEIDELKNEVRQDMRQSRTTATNEGADPETGKTSRYRTSANAWIEDHIEERFKYLNKRVALITGLNTTGYFSTEIVQIAAYNPGGHYTPHSDAMFEDQVTKLLPESEIQRGDRIMTFMIYLSDVEKGGGTGFPTLRTCIQPVKGSAVAWYNLHSNGKINYDALHGGCPVLYGTKWIANKWIRSNDQMFQRPCPKNREHWRI